MEPISAPTASPAAGAAQAATPERMISSDFETFLRMLTAQIENQDPLNPLESSDFAVQLATFSGVEQQVRTNELISALDSRMGALGMAQLAGLVGMEALAPVPAEYRGAPVTILPAPQTVADRAELVVRDSAGVVERFTIPVLPERFEWSGILPDGSALPAGRYSFGVVSYDAAGAVLLTETPPIYTRVIEARNEEGATRLILDGGTSVDAQEVTGLRPGNA